MAYGAGIVLGPFNYTNITSNATNNAIVGRAGGVFHGIMVNTAGSAWTATIWDSITAAGTKIGTASLNTQVLLTFDALLTTGLTIVTAGTTPGDITVLWGN